MQQVYNSKIFKTGDITNKIETWVNTKLVPMQV